MTHARGIQNVYLLTRLPYCSTCGNISERRKRGVAPCEIYPYIRDTHSSLSVRFGHLKRFKRPNRTDNVLSLSITLKKDGKAALYGNKSLQLCNRHQNVVYSNWWRGFAASKRQGLIPWHFHI